MEGYPKLAALMGERDEFAIFRGFRALGMQNLLHLQAEIVHISDELRRLTERDAAHPERQFHARDWWSLTQGDCDEDTEQWEKTLELRELLDKYYDAVLKQASIAGLGKPRKYDLNFLRDWLERPSMGAFPLLGLDRTSWETENGSDLVAIHPRLPPDTFSRWFSERVLPIYHRLLGTKLKNSISKDIGSGIYNYEEASLLRLFEILTTVVASVLPISSVALLFFIDTYELRLGLIVAFSAIFSFALCLMTSARKVEVFAATAAYAAVNVVFLTNNSCQPIQASGC